MRTNSPDFEEGTLNARSICPGEIRPGDMYGYKVVLKVSESTLSFMAYVAPTSWSDTRAFMFGDAISIEGAKNVFPVVVETLLDQGYLYRTE